jgi:hypothetical protein
LQTTCQPPSSWVKDPWPATIRDISNGGLSLTLARRFERGSGLAIELPGGDCTTSTVLARVVQVTPYPEGGWLLSCLFISQLSDEEIRSVLRFDHPANDTTSTEDAEGAASPDDPAERPAINGVLFQARLRPGEIVRWYINRLKLGSSWPLAVGTVISLRLGSPGTPSLQLIVKKCELVGEFWLVNGKFQSPPSPEVLRALGYSS